jgi:hypothetical protein
MRQPQPTSKLAGIVLMVLTLIVAQFDTFHLRAYLFYTITPQENFQILLVANVQSSKHELNHKREPLAFKILSTFISGGRN